MEEKYDPKKVWDKIIKKQKKAFRSEGEYWRRMANALRKRKLREGGYPPYNDKHLRWWNND